MTRNITFAALTLAFLAAPAAHAATYGSTAIVAGSGGDYTDVAVAVADVGTWCGTPSDTNRCQVKIMPGNYPLTSQLPIPAWVDIAGAGRNSTVLEGTGTTSFQVFMHEHSEIRSLTLRIAGWPTGSGIYMGGNPATPSVHTAVRDVRLEMSGLGSGNSAGIRYWYGAPIIENSDIVMDMQSDQKGISGSYGSPQIFGVNITMNGIHSNYGMDFLSGKPSIRSSTVNVSNGSVRNQGIVMRQTRAVLEDVEVVSVGGSAPGSALINAGGGLSNSRMIRVRAEGYGNPGYGVANTAPSSTSQLVQSWVTGSTAGVLTDGGHVSQISQTQINGGVTTLTGTTTCAAVVDGGTYVFHQNTCP